jgi:DNA mismatch repair protein MutS2
VATTHLGALKAYALTRTRVENASVEFDPQTLQPTYHLRIGESGSSNAIEVAQRLGLPKRLVAAARRNLSRKARALRAALRDTADAKRQAEQAREAAQVAQLGASRAQDEAGAARVRLEQQQQEFRHWVQRVVHLQPGDAVRVRNFDRDGRVVRVRLDQQRAEVNVGAFSVEVPLGDVLPPETAPPPPRPARPDRPPPAAKPKPSRKPAVAHARPPIRPLRLRPNRPSNRHPHPGRPRRR